MPLTTLLTCLRVLRLSLPVPIWFSQPCTWKVRASLSQTFSQSPCLRLGRYVRFEWGSTLRHGEIQGLLWENYRDGELFVSRSIWNGRVSDPKTRKGRAPVPVIRQLAERLELHRLRSGNPETGPIFANASGNPLALSSVVNRVILPSLNRCAVCRKAETTHCVQDHRYARDNQLPQWRGWHAARRGLGSNLYRLGVPDMVIQRILRHANVSTTATYYIKTAADDVRNAMTKLENVIPNVPQKAVEEKPLTPKASTLRDTYGTLNLNSTTVPSTVN